MTYMGHILTENGLKPDPEKVNAILKMPKPENSVRRLLAMANYLSRYLRKFADTCESLREWTRPNNAWEWSDKQGRAVREIKQAITTAPVLRYFDTTKPTLMQCDASSLELGALLLQDGQPISYASRALTECKRGYAQIEKE